MSFPRYECESCECVVTGREAPRRCPECGDEFLLDGFREHVKRAKQSYDASQMELAWALFELYGRDTDAISFAEETGVVIRHSMYLISLWKKVREVTLDKRIVKFTVEMWAKLRDSLRGSSVEDEVDPVGVLRDRLYKLVGDLEGLDDDIRGRLDKVEREAESLADLALEIDRKI